MNIKLPLHETPSYRATWAPVYLEPITGSGERITVGVVLNDPQGSEVRRTIRDDALKALYGSKRAHLTQMIEAVLEALRAQGSLRQPSIPLTGFTLGSWREASSRAERYGVFRQAFYRSSSLANLDELEMQEDEIATQEGTTRQWFKQIQEQVIQQRPQLANAFNVDVPLISNGLPPRLGFLYQKRGANFETLRPIGLTATVRAARGRLYELTRIMRQGDLERGALVLGVPRQDDLTYPEKALQASARAIHELQHEASEDRIALLEAYSVNDAAAHILQLAA